MKVQKRCRICHRRKNLGHRVKHHVYIDVVPTALMIAVMMLVHNWIS